RRKACEVEEQARRCRVHESSGLEGPDATAVIERQYQRLAHRAITSATVLGRCHRRSRQQVDGKVGCA
ncbi:MAG: hypothetical protein OXR73_27035, partial [Myxococcales bacterium]|nr:hypothetical protein [Myxococcales bacterium]